MVAYGIRGDMVAYTVNYQDADGNELAPSQQFYGNVGDKPVVAYRYIDGYVPQAAALTKTLSSNEAENVFTFVYEEGESGTVVQTPGTAGGVTTVVETVTVTEGTGTAGTGTSRNRCGGYWSSRPGSRYSSRNRCGDSRSGSRNRNHGRNRRCRNCGRTDWRR